eukprot:gene5371-biopygen379
MTSKKLLLINYREFNQPELVKLGDGNTVEARGSGRSQITIETSHNKQLTIEMDNVLYVPKLACNLFSVRAVTQKGLIVQFGHTCCWIKDSDGKAVGKGRLVKRMYVLSCETEITAAYHQSETMENSNPSTMDIWHQRLGHINIKQLLESVKKKLIKGVAIQGNDELNFCTGCAEKAERRKLDKKANRLRFLGYSANQKGYRLFDMQSKRIVIRRDVNFNENDFGSQKQYLKMGPEPAKEDKRQSEPTERDTDAEESHPRRSQRSTKGVPPPRFGLDEYADVTEAKHVVFSAIIKKPATIQEAFNSEYSAQ